MGRIQPSLPSRVSSQQATAAGQVAATDALAEIANRGGTTSTGQQSVPTGLGASLGALVPLQTRPDSMGVSQTIAAGYSAVLFRPLTIPAGVKLTVNGFLAITNITYNAAA